MNHCVRGFRNLLEIPPNKEKIFLFRAKLMKNQMKETKVRDRKRLVWEGNDLFLEEEAASH